MKQEERIMSNGGIEIDFTFLGVAMLIIAFWGEPDLVDALIHYFLNKSWMVLI